MCTPATRRSVPFHPRPTPAAYATPNHAEDADARSCSRAPSARFGLCGQEPVEEGAVARQSDTEILRRDVVAALPLRLEPTSLVREASRQLLHQLGDERVGLGNRLAGLVDEARLDLLPAPREALALVLGQERTSLSGRAGGRGARGRGRLRFDLLGPVVGAGSGVRVIWALVDLNPLARRGLVGRRHLAERVLISDRLCTGALIRSSFLRLVRRLGCAPFRGLGEVTGTQLVVCHLTDRPFFTRLAVGFRDRFVAESFTRGGLVVCARLDQVIEEHAVVAHGLTQVLGRALTVATRLGESVPLAIGLDHVRVVDRNVRGALLEVLDWIATLGHDRTDQIVRTCDCCTGVVDELCLNAPPGFRVAVAGCLREGSDLELSAPFLTRL